MIHQSAGPSLKELMRSIVAIGGDRGRKSINEGIAAESLRLVKRGFERSEDPYGIPWKPPVLRDGKPLLDSSRLRNGFQNRSTPTTIELWNNVRYAAIQNYGGTIHAKNSPYLYFKTPEGLAAKKEVTLPARQMIPDSARGLPPVWDQRMRIIADKVLRTQVLGVR